MSIFPSALINKYTISVKLELQRSLTYLPKLADNCEASGAATIIFPRTWSDESLGGKKGPERLCVKEL